MVMVRSSEVQKARMKLGPPPEPRTEPFDTEKNQCEYCGTTLRQVDTQCPYCGAPRRIPYNDDEESNDEWEPDLEAESTIFV